jgi:putative SOS response-associated peptidase YedK
MCGRFMQERPVSELAEIFEAEPLVDEPGGRYNIAPTDEAIVVVQRDDRRALTGYRWGLIPHWSADARIASRTFNARAESIASMPAFRDSFRRKRCLVPVDAFYEWRRQDGVRQPYRIFRADGRPLVLAGLWDGWKDPDSGEVRRTFTIVTTTPNAVVRRAPQPNAGDHPGRRVGSLAGSAAGRTRRAASPARTHRCRRARDRAGVAPRERRVATTDRACSCPRIRATRNSPSFRDASGDDVVGTRLLGLRSRRAPSRCCRPARGRRPVGRPRIDRGGQLAHETIERIGVVRRRPSTIASAGSPTGSRPPSATTAINVPLLQPVASAATPTAASSRSPATTTTRNSVR